MGMRERATNIRPHAAYHATPLEHGHALHAAQEEGQRDAQAREAELGEALAKRIAESEANISDAMDEAIVNIRDVAVEVSVSAAERLTGEAPSPDAANSAVDAAIKARG